MALPLPAPPSPLGYIGDAESAQNALTDAQLKTASDQAKQPYFDSEAASANQLAAANAQNAQWKANNPLFNASSSDAQTIAQINYLHKIGQDESANQLLQAWKARQASLGATANYKNVMAGIAPQKLKVSQQNSYATLNKMPGAKQNMVTDSQQFAAQPKILAGATNALANNNNAQPNPVQPANSNAPRTAPISIPPVQNGVAVNPNTGPAPEGSNLSTNIAPPGATTNEAVQGMPNALKSVDPDTLSDDEFNRRKAIILSDIKGNTTAKTYNRIEAGMALDDLLNSPTLDNAFKTMEKYQGAYGEGWAKEAEGWASNDPRYQELSSARKQFNGIITGSLSALEGYPSTDQSVKMAKQYFQSAQRNFNMSPQQAKIDFEMGKQFARQEVESLMTTTAYKIDDLVRHATTTPPKPPGKTRVVGPDGKLYNIPIGNLQKAIKKGFKEAP